ncbi:MAG: patatin-like phospholipase family protein [bacterium]|nr:patatin-like phospholipase family protein [bacterium]
MKRVGILLPGAGLLGATHVGMLRALCQRGIHKKLAVLRANSSGALTGTTLSEAQTPDEFPELVEKAAAGWRLIEARGPDAIFGISSIKSAFGKVSVPGFIEHPIRNISKLLWKKSGELRKLKVLLAKDGLLETERLSQIITEYQPKLTLDSYFRFEVAVLNLTTQEFEILSANDFKNDPESFKKVPVASASLQPFFPSVEIKGSRYCDARNTGEMSPELKECDTIFVLVAHPAIYPLGSPKELRERYGLPPIIGNLIFENNFWVHKLEEASIHDLQHALVGRGAVHVIYAQNPPTASPIGFEKGDIPKEIKLGEAAVNAALDATI